MAAKKKYRAIVSYIAFAMYDVEASSVEAAEKQVELAIDEEGDELESPQIDEIFEYMGDDIPDDWTATTPEKEE